MARRKAGTLVPLESEILEVAITLLRRGTREFHGFGIAQALRERSGSNALTAHGTLYKALGRLEEFGLVTSRWEDPAAAVGRPRRRLYTLSHRGIAIIEQALAGRPVPTPPRARIRTAPA